MDLSASAAARIANDTQGKYRGMMQAQWSRNVLLYGDEADLPRPMPLRAGPLSLLFEAGDLRYVRYGEHEIVRRIYVAVRDRNWSTIPMRITDLVIDASDNRFAITYSADHHQREIDFHWKATIQGTPEGRISFSMQGEARSTFLRNRVGFCVLHPATCAGAMCRVVQEFGEVIEKPFPRLTAPAPKEDPFQEIREMSYQVTQGVWADLRFEGDVFETEDQRNWIDGSYKTFCTPLRLAFPVEIQAGTQISQRVDFRLRLDGPPPSATNSPGVPQFRVDSEAIALVQLGLGLTQLSHNERQVARLKALNLSHLRADLHLNNAAAKSEYLLAVEQASKIGAPLELAVYLSKEAERELAHLTEWIRPEHPIARWLIFHESEKTTPPALLVAARRALSVRSPSAKFAGGSSAYFTELNRERPDLSVADVIGYSVNPQVHAFDNTSLIENAQAIAFTVESARALSGGRPIAITPITLRPRFNPDATGGDEQTGPEIPATVDPRQMSLFGAVWTLASLKAIVTSGAASATYYESVGWLGVIERDEGSPLPDRFRSAPGAVFPLYHVLRLVGEFRGGEVVRSESGRPLLVEGMVLRKDGRLRVLLANLTLDPQQITIEGLNGEFLEKRLYESNAASAMQSPDEFCASAGTLRRTSPGAMSVDLPPYGVAWLDSR
jgi:hypothetical protein